VLVSEGSHTARYGRCAGIRIGDHLVAEASVAAFVLFEARGPGLHGICVMYARIGCSTLAVTPASWLSQICVAPTIQIAFARGER
jgi:hypothetical protein